MLRHFFKATSNNRVGIREMSKRTTNPIRKGDSTPGGGTPGGDGELGE